MKELLISICMSLITGFLLIIVPFKITLGICAVIMIYLFGAFIMDVYKGDYR